MVYRKTVTTTRRKNKRWYVNAGFTAPFIGKTHINMGNQKLTKRALAPIIKSVSRGQSEPKHKLITSLVYTSPLHNTIYTWNVFGNIAQGDTTFTRTGDTIQPEALKMKFLFNRSTLNDVTQYIRMVFFKSSDESSGGLDTFGSGLGSGDIFKNVGAVATAWMTDSKLVTVLDDQIWRLPDPSITGQGLGKTIDYFYKFKNLTFNYKNGTNYGKKENYYMILIPYITGGSTGVTPGPSMACTVDLIFKDL